MMKKDFWSDILIFLLNPKHTEAGFEEIRKGVGGSPRSINNHLKQLFEQGFIKKGWGKRGKFSLTDEGEANAAHERDLRGITTILERAPNDALELLRKKLEESEEKVEFVENVLLDGKLLELEIFPKLIKDVKQHIKEHPKLGYTRSLDFIYDAVKEKLIKEEKKR